MEQGELLILVIVVLVVLAALFIWLSARRGRTNALKAKFGDEYDRTVAATGDRHKAEANLRERADRVSKLDIRPLTPVERRDFAREWQEVKAVFVDSPPEAVLHADRLVVRMLQARGFPMGDFDRRHEDLTVSHPEVASHYRAGREITERLAHGQAGTEDMRQALRHYEALVDGMLSDVSDTVKVRPVTAQAQQR